MGNSNEKKPGVPSWQLKLKETTPTEADTEPEPPNRETVVAQAKKFLEEDEVRNESTDKKIAFLESKGLTGAEIQELLGVTRNTEASSPPSATPPLPQAEPSQTPTQTRTETSPSPPIITYPEFLTTPPHPTPLVTKSRLLGTLYAFSAISALLYGTNTYLITPMLAQLTTSRLSLAESASSNLQTLIQKLESMVSEIPANKAIPIGVKEDEEDEDPTEMFHRDIGVQTSLPGSSLPSRPESPSHHLAVENQTQRLATLKTSLQELVTDGTSEGQDVSDLSMTINVLKEYLDGLAYVVPSYGYGYGNIGGGMGKEDDEIGRVKASIRGVKGVLLSARSFPGVARVGR